MRVILKVQPHLAIDRRGKEPKRRHYPRIVLGGPWMSHLGVEIGDAVEISDDHNGVIVVRKAQ